MKTYDPNAPEEKEVQLPNAPKENLKLPSASSAKNLTGFLQPPLSRRGHGPGVVMFTPPPAPSGSKKAKTLDPEPVLKWAEEGYGIAGIEGSASISESDAKAVLEAAIAALKAHKDIDIKDKFAVFVYEPKAIKAVAAAASAIGNEIVLLSAIGSEVPESCTVASIEHIFPDNPAEGTLTGEAEDITEEEPIPDPNFNPYTDNRRTQKYVTKTSSPFTVLPDYGDEIYDAGVAALVHTRTLTFLKYKIGGPWFDLEKIWDQHTWYEFVGRSVAKTMGTMVAEPYVNHVPTMIGGMGRKDLSAFYRDHFIFANPPDSRMEVVSRTIGIDRIIDEFIFVCNHTTHWEWFLPGVPPTGKSMRVPFVAVVCIRGDRLYHEHIWWDQATALRQAGVLPETVPWKDDKSLRLPVGGVETANKLQYHNVPSNQMFGSDWGVIPANMLP